MHAGHYDMLCCICRNRDKQSEWIVTYQGAGQHMASGQVGKWASVRPVARSSEIELAKVGRRGVEIASEHHAVALGEPARQQRIGCVCLVEALAGQRAPSPVVDRGPVPGRAPPAVPGRTGLPVARARAPRHRSDAAADPRARALRRRAAGRAGVGPAARSAARRARDGDRRVGLPAERQARSATPPHRRADRRNRVRWMPSASSSTTRRPSSPPRISRLQHRPAMSRSVCLSETLASLSVLARSGVALRRAGSFED
jgi:hypothetical protein